MTEVATRAQGLPIATLFIGAEDLRKLCLEAGAADVGGVLGRRLPLRGC